MRRLVPVAGAVVLIGPLVVVALVVAPGDTLRRSPLTALGRHRRSRGRSSRPRPAACSTTRSRRPRRTSYRGVQFVSAWSPSGTTSEVVDVDHEPGRGTTVRTDGTARVAGPQHDPGRRGRPRRSTGRRRRSAARAALLAGRGRRRTRSPAGTADVVVARRPGAPATAPDAARFWLDRESGLVLRREVYDRRGPHHPGQRLRRGDHRRAGACSPARGGAAVVRGDRHRPP